MLVSEAYDSNHGLPHGFGQAQVTNNEFGNFSRPQQAVKAQTHQQPEGNAGESELRVSHCFKKGVRKQTPQNVERMA